MRQTEIVKIIQKNAEIEGLTLTQEYVRVLVDIFEKSIGEVYDSLEQGESSNVFFLKIGKKYKKASSGISRLRGEEVEWETPSKEKIVVGGKVSFIEKHTKELNE